MGQKVNPIGLRLGINRTWDSRWYAGKTGYGVLLHEDMKISELVVARRRQRELVAYALHPFVRSGDDRQLEREIGGAARHRSDHGEVAAHRDRRRLRRQCAALRKEIEARFMGVHAAEMCRRTQRTANVRAELE